MAATLPEILDALATLRRADADDVDAAVVAMGPRAQDDLRALASEFASPIDVDARRRRDMEVTVNLLRRVQPIVEYIQTFTDAQAAEDEWIEYVDTITPEQEVGIMGLDPDWVREMAAKLND